MELIIAISVGLYSIVVVYQLKASVEKFKIDHRKAYFTEVKAKPQPEPKAKEAA